MKRKGKYYLLAAFAALAVTVCVGGYSAWQYFWGGAVARDAVVLVPTGSDFDRLTDSLRRSGALRNVRKFVRIARIRGLDETVRPGRYKLDAGMTYAALIDRLKQGLQAPVRVTFNNVRTLDRLAGSVGRRLETDSATLARALLSDSTARAYGYAPQTFIGMFIPNNYEMYWNSSADDFIRRMKKESDRFWKKRDAKLARTGLSRDGAMTLASIVYEETKRKDEMPVVAGVYINRLKRGMPLQADPTVKFAVGDFSIKRVLHTHLAVDSPYNTYKYPGLPSGPICMPSIAAIDAVLDYADHDYLYFCAKDDLSGAHNFAKTLSEHNRNAAAYVRALNRLKIK